MAAEPPPLDLEYLIRPNILKLQPYRCARDENKGREGVFLDANENGMGPCIPVEGDMHRYPSPYQVELKEKIAEFREVKPDQIFLGVGSDEAIDMVLRVFCVPGKHCAMITPPTYGMYKVMADINDVTVQFVPLNEDFTLNLKKVLENVIEETRVIFLCSPNNPTGNTLDHQNIIKLLTKATYRGVVVIDEAYIDFSYHDSMVSLIKDFPRLIVLQTMSKSFGLAGIRLGWAIGHPSIISIFNNVKAPYNISKLTSEVALRAMSTADNLHKTTEIIRRERFRVYSTISRLPCVEEAFRSDTNFVLFRVRRAHDVYTKMADRGIVIRYRGNQPHCNNCLRITVGTAEENDRALAVLKEILDEHRREEVAAGLPPYRQT